MNKCIGCGAILQIEDKNKNGFIPKEKQEGAKYCLRCFRIIHYNDLKVLELNNKTEVLSVVNQKGKFAFFLADLFNINSEVLATYHKIKIPKCFIVSKIDFIPKDINKNKIKEWLAKEYKVKEDILFLSALKGYNMHCINKMMDAHGIKKAYLLGYANSGKSTLLNKLTKEEVITTSIVPNTTIDFIPIKIDANKTIMDSPGFLYEDALYKNNLSLMKKVNLKTKMKPITFQLKRGMSILIEEFVRIENRSEKCNVTIYMSNLLDIKKIYEKNTSLKNSKEKEVSILKNQDLVFKGLGFIHSKSNANLKIYMEKMDSMEVRNSFFER